MSRTMRLVYIAHPLGVGPTRAENIARASRWCAWAWLGGEGLIPIAPWIVLASVVPETDGARERGLLLDRQTITRCDEVWLVGGRVSPGMQIERDHAEACGISVLDLTHMGPEPPAL